MAFKTKNSFWLNFTLTSVLYLLIMMAFDLIWKTDGFLFSGIYLIKKLISAIVVGFIFALLISPENPFRKKKAQ